MRSSPADPKEAERMARALQANRGRNITDYKSFSKAYDRYFETKYINPHLKDFKYMIWVQYSNKIKSSLAKFETEAIKDRTKNLFDQLPKRQITPRELYERVRDGKAIDNVMTASPFPFLGKRKQATAYGKPTRDKRGRVHFRDPKGRFISVNKDKFK